MTVTPQKLILTMILLNICIGIAGQAVAMNYTDTTLIDNLLLDYDDLSNDVRDARNLESNSGNSGIQFTGDQSTFVNIWNMGKSVFKFILLAMIVNPYRLFTLESEGQATFIEIIIVQVISILQIVLNMLILLQAYYIFTGKGR